MLLPNNRILFRLGCFVDDEKENFVDCTTTYKPEARYPYGIIEYLRYDEQFVSSFDFLWRFKMREWVKLNEEQFRAEVEHWITDPNVRGRLFARIAMANIKKNYGEFIGPENQVKVYYLTCIGINKFYSYFRRLENTSYTEEKDFIAAMVKALHSRKLTPMLDLDYVWVNRFYGKVNALIVHAEKFRELFLEIKSSLQS